MSVAQDLAVSIAERKVPDAKGFGLAWFGGFYDFARPSGEKEPAYDQVDGVIVGVGDNSGRIFRGALAAEVPQKLRRDCLLSFRRGFDVVHRF